MRLTRTLEIDATAETVWDVFAHRFNDAGDWMASVPRSYGNPTGEPLEGASTAGRICELRPDGTGMKASERFVAYDEAARTCSVRVDLIDPPAVFPIRHNGLDFSVIDGPEGRSTATFVFSAELKPWAWLLWPLLRLGMTMAWSQLCEEFQHYVETGQPHPRKLAAIERATAASA